MLFCSWRYFLCSEICGFAADSCPHKPTESWQEGIKRKEKFRLNIILTFLPFTFAHIWSTLLDHLWESVKIKMMSTFLAAPWTSRTQQSFAISISESSWKEKQDNEIPSSPRSTKNKQRQSNKQCLVKTHRKQTRCITTKYFGNSIFCSSLCALNFQLGHRNMHRKTKDGYPLAIFRFLSCLTIVLRIPSIQRTGTPTCLFCRKNTSFFLLFSG